MAVLGLQGMPLQSLIQSVQHGAAHHECSHPDGVCPMNPDGPCPCNHDSSSSSDTPTLKSCTDSSPVEAPGAWTDLGLELALDAGMVAGLVLVVLNSSRWAPRSW